MAGKPQREKAKTAIQIVTDADVRSRLSPLLAGRRKGEASLSRLVETLLFLLESVYIEDSNEKFVRTYYGLKSRRLREIAEAGREPSQKRVHVTIDRGACTFADLMTRRHPCLFRTRSELATILLYQAGLYCKNDTSLRYFTRRLEHASQTHPKRHP